MKVLDENAYSPGFKSKKYSKIVKALDAVSQMVKEPQARLPVFAEVIKASGARRYHVASYPIFFNRYMQMDPEKRVYHEVVTESSACKLFFDLDMAGVSHKVMEKCVNALVKTSRDYLMKILVIG